MSRLEEVPEVSNRQHGDICKLVSIDTNGLFWWGDLGKIPIGKELVWSATLTQVGGPVCSYVRCKGADQSTSPLVDMLYNIQ